MRKIKHNLARNDLARAYIKAEKCSGYNLNESVTIEPVSRSRGDVTQYEVADPDNFGKFIVTDLFIGEMDRLSSSMIMKSYLDKGTGLYDFLYNGEPIDIQVHFGDCTNPQNFNEFTKAIIFENVFATNWDTTQLVTTASDEREVISETVEISIGNMLEIFDVKVRNLTSNFPNLALGPITDVAIQTPYECKKNKIGQFDTTNIFMTQIVEGTDICGVTGDGNPTLYLWYSWNGGKTFDRQEIDIFQIGIIDDLTDCTQSLILEGINLSVKGVNLYLSLTPGQVAIFNLAELYATNTLKLTFYSGQLGTFDWTIFTHFVTNGYTIVGGELGNVWKIGNSINDIVQHIIPDATDSTIVYSIDGLNEETFIVGTLDGVFYNYGNILKHIPNSPNAVLNVVMFDEDTFLAATSNAIFYTCDRGLTWEAKTYMLNEECIYKIQFFNNHVGIMLTNSYLSGPRIYRSIDMGISWSRIEQIEATSFSQDYIITSVALSEDPNYFVVTGRYDTTYAGNFCDHDATWNINSDGILILGNTYKNNKL